MSDFLNNLIARHNEATPQVMPRQATRFEADTATPQPALVDEFSNEPEQPTPFQQTVARSQVTAAAEPNTPDPIRPTSVQPDLAPIALAPAPQMQAQRANLLDANQVPRSSTLALQTQDSLVQPRVSQTPAQPQQLAQQHVLEVLETRRLDPQTVRSQTVRIEKGLERTIQQQTPEILPQIQPYIPSEAPIITQQPTPASPIIHVTIGRVEVRAAASPPVRQERSAPRQSHVLTLEEYLQRRRGGS